MSESTESEKRTTVQKKAPEKMGMGKNNNKNLLEIRRKSDEPVYHPHVKTFLSLLSVIVLMTIFKL